MPENPQLDEFLQYVEDLTKATVEGKITWSKPNPTTYQWIKALPSRPPEARITLQYVETQERRVAGGVIHAMTVKKFILSAFDGANALRFTVDSIEHPQALQKLQALFQTIGVSLDRKGLDFLKSILPQ